MWLCICAFLTATSGPGSVFVPPFGIVGPHVECAELNMPPGNNDFPPVDDWRAELPQINSLTLHPYIFTIPPSYSHSSTPSDTSSSGGNGSVGSPQGLAQGPGYVHQATSRHNTSQPWVGRGGATFSPDDPPFDPRRQAHASSTSYSGHGHGHVEPVPSFFPELTPYPFFGGSTGIITDRHQSYDSGEGSPGGSSRSLGSGSYSDQDASSPEGGYEVPVERSHPRHDQHARAQYSSSTRAALAQQRVGLDQYHRAASEVSGSRGHYRSQTQIGPEDTGFHYPHNYRYHAQNPPPPPPPRRTPPPRDHSATPAGRRSVDDPGPMLRQMLNIPADIPLNLRALPDPPPGEKPKQPYPVLVQLAIYGSPRKRLTLQEIYSALEGRFEWFKERSKEMQWKNSIRHNLSLNKVFRQVPRPITEPGKGKYWVVDLSEGTGNKRERKRNRKRKNPAPSGGTEQDSSGEDSEDVEMSHSQQSQGSRSQYSQQSTNTSSSTSHSSRADETNIDPRLRDSGTGHSVGEGRLRGSMSPRRGPTPPYPPSPSIPLRLPASTPSAFPGEPQPFSSMSAGPSTARPQHTSLSSVTQGMPGATRFGQPAFGQRTLGHPAFGQPSLGSNTALPPARTSSGPRAFMAAASENIVLGPQAAASGRSSRTTASPGPGRFEPTPKPGVEYIRDSAGWVRARRINTPGSAGDNGSHSEEEARMADS